MPEKKAFKKGENGERPLGQSQQFHSVVMLNRNAYNDNVF